MEWVQPFREVYLPVPVIGELRFGALNSRRSSENLARVEELLARCPILDVTVNTTRVYAEVRLGLKRRGTPIPEDDVWIAAVCLEHDLSLISSDEHFEAVEGLKLIKR
jgi:tRNA(fMet)-specific endonuclease VapC